VTEIRGGTATAERPPRPQPAAGGRGASSGSWFARFGLFYRQVIAELRKVIWPTRKELGTYTSVVLVFVVAVTTIVALLDLGFTKAVLWVFG
jgi:preprotein translocase subunit SecE